MIVAASREIRNQTALILREYRRRGFVCGEVVIFIRYEPPTSKFGRHLPKAKIATFKIANVDIEI
jgi:hypothetical protein